MINNDNKTKIVLGILGTIILLATIAAIVILVVMPGIREAQEEKELQAKEAEIIEEIMELKLSIIDTPEPFKPESIKYINDKGGAQFATKEDFKKALELSEHDLKALVDILDGAKILYKEVERDEELLWGVEELSDNLREIPRGVERHLDRNKQIHATNIDLILEHLSISEERVEGMKSLIEQFERLSK